MSTLNSQLPYSNINTCDVSSYSTIGTLFANVVQSLKGQSRLKISSPGYISFFVGSSGTTGVPTQVLDLTYSNSTLSGPLMFLGSNSTSFQFIPNDPLQTIMIGSNLSTYIDSTLNFQTFNTQQIKGFRFLQSITSISNITAAQNIFVSTNCNYGTLSQTPHSLLTNTGILDQLSSNQLGSLIKFGNLMYPSTSNWLFQFQGPDQSGNLSLTQATTIFTGSNSNTTTNQIFSANSNGLNVISQLNTPLIQSDQANYLTIPLSFKAYSYNMNVNQSNGIVIQQNNSSTVTTQIQAINSNILQLTGTDNQSTVKIANTFINSQTIGGIAQQVFTIDPSTSLQAFNFQNPINLTTINAQNGNFDIIGPYTTSNKQVSINGDLQVMGRIAFTGGLDTTNATNLHVQDKQIVLSKPDDPNQPSSNVQTIDGTANDQSGIIIDGIISGITDSNVYKKQLLWNYNAGINASTVQNRSFWQLQGGAFNLARYIPSTSNLVQYQQAVEDDGSLSFYQITSSNTYTKVLSMGILASNQIYT